MTADGYGQLPEGGGACQVVHFIGFSPYEKHSAEFRSGPLPDEPQITVWLAVAAATARS